MKQGGREMQTSEDNGDGGDGDDDGDDNDDDKHWYYRGRVMFDDDDDERDAHCITRAIGRQPGSVPTATKPRRCSVNFVYKTSATH